LVRWLVYRIDLLPGCKRAARQWLRPPGIAVANEFINN